MTARRSHDTRHAEQEKAQAVQREAGKHPASRIKQHPAPSTISEHVHDTLLAEIRRAYLSSVNAAVRREGEWRSLSYTPQLGHGARKLAVAALQESVTEFTRAVPDAVRLSARGERAADPGAAADEHRV